ncbi:carbohydrate sulfotransferase 11 [Diaphorina citri]|uniref:Carbohydrate sulfotransferase n=1 Tax=Diaphorina citri TaxID=121845 RepID=A0A3Q0IVH8_DIACI|nr:carbohydrate sulfotransferase 11 [Diaphorina citri]
MGSNIFLKITIYVLIFFSFCVVFFEVFWFSQKFSSGDIMKVNAKTYNIPSMNKNWSLTHFERLEYLTSQCLTYKEDLNKSSVLEDEQVLEHILVDKKHKLLYCYVPKVACTNWKRIFLILVGQINTTDPSSIPADVAHKLTMNYKLSNFSKDEIHHFLESYTKFLFVRHPFERLVSAFHNKLEQSYSSSKYFQSRFGKHIIKTIRTRPTNHSLNHGDDVTFNEFATFLTKNGRGEEMNEHWRPVHHLCQPCKINYDFIGKHETLYEDANLLLREIGVPQVNFSFQGNTKRCMKMPISS